MYQCMICITNTTKISLIHTHPFNSPFSGTTRVSRYQKGKTNLDFTEARESEWQWHQLGHMQVCTLLQTDNHASNHHSVFYRPDALPAAQPRASKQWILRCISVNDSKKNSLVCYFCCPLTLTYTRLTTSYSGKMYLYFVYWTDARRRGRPRMAWMDNIKRWTGLSVEESIRMTEDRDKWRKYVHGVANPRIEDG